MRILLSKQTLRLEKNWPSSSSAAARMPSPHFYFFKSPTVIMPSFEIMRRISNPINRFFYRIRNEPKFTYDGFMNGAIQAVLLSARALRERKMEKFREISTEQCTKYFINRLPEFTEKQLKDKLDIDQKHIINGFIHASFYSRSTVVKTTLDSLIFYSTFVFFIDKTGKFAQTKKSIVAARRDEDEDEITSNLSVKKFPPPSAPSIRQLLKKPEDLLVCNMTLSRCVGAAKKEEFGRWRITDLNFFDCEFAMDKLHTY